MTALLCLCSCPDDDTADRIADALVAGRLAACVQVLPGMTSVYRWQGRVERAREVLLLAKTTQARFDDLRAQIVALHPHDVPEVVALDIADGLPAYLDWVTAETTPERAG
ncbi:divalent-cation tolerance protein CutA [Luteimonas aestuarii]|uniref:Divalent-cation tolerance protein CutA n=1 Tax=Luteimonas aestuarii TaxID=453837 RepID=A0A4R5TS82_9GAMM|nr:divalent-cation tolerance protein CutA [Luteimonas aestuarii]TDK22715.1 divalent-cation tolerance protein CutA [Luteimonas aestuarii]